MDSRTAVCSRRSFEENELGLALGVCERLLEKAFFFPEREYFLFEIVGRAIGGEQPEAAGLRGTRFAVPSPRRLHGADGGHSRLGPVELEPAPRNVLATTCESEASTSES